MKLGEPERHSEVPERSALTHPPFLAACWGGLLLSETQLHCLLNGIFYYVP